MEKIIKEPLAIIVGIVLGSGTGWSLSGFIDAVEIKQWLTAIAIAFSLMISLMISAYYKSNRRKIRKQKFWKYSIACIILFIGMLITFFISYNSLETRLLVNVEQLDSSLKTTDSTFIKGLYFTPEAKNEIAAIRRTNPDATIDLKKIFKDSGSNIEQVWSNTSRILAKLVILLSYVFFIASLTSAITITTELIQDSIKKNNSIPSV